MIILLNSNWNLQILVWLKKQHHKLSVKIKWKARSWGEKSDLHIIYPLINKCKSLHRVRTHMSSKALQCMTGVFLGSNSNARALGSEFTSKSIHCFMCIFDNLNTWECSYLSFPCIFGILSLLQSQKVNIYGTLVIALFSG